MTTVFLLLPKTALCTPWSMTWTITFKAVWKILWKQLWQRFKCRKGFTTKGLFSLERSLWNRIVRDVTRQLHVTTKWLDHNISSYIKPKHWPPNSPHLFWNSPIENLWSILLSSVDRDPEPKAVAQLKCCLHATHAEKWSVISQQDYEQLLTKGSYSTVYTYGLF